MVAGSTWERLMELKTKRGLTGEKSVTLGKIVDEAFKKKNKKKETKGEN